MPHHPLASCRFAARITVQALPDFNKGFPLAWRQDSLSGSFRMIGQ
jgi:hypothetical protein